ncbi:MAG: hypothetical protein HGA47_02495 [Zoogloea sp.]|nr:hypothetical protein [Zoogloea sp.]
MMQPSTRSVRLRLTPALLGWALVDLAGVVIVALGGAYLAAGITVIPGLPGNTLQAVLCILAGIGTISVAGVKMLAETFYQRMPRQDGTTEE